jgi:putative ABC transport system substrate-binding protein
LIAYGPSLHGAFRPVTTLVVKILQGRRPGDIPVEQPTKFALYLNFKTAHALNLVVPSLLLLRADKTIE